MRGGDGELLVMVLGETRRAGAVQHWPRARWASRDSALSHTRIRRPHRHTSGDAQLAAREDGSAHLVPVVHDVRHGGLALTPHMRSESLVDDDAYGARAGQ